MMNILPVKPVFLLRSGKKWAAPKGRQPICYAHRKRAGNIPDRTQPFPDGMFRFASLFICCQFSQSCALLIEIKLPGMFADNPGNFSNVNSFRKGCCTRRGKQSWRDILSKQSAPGAVSGAVRYSAARRSSVMPMTAKVSGSSTTP